MRAQSFVAVGSEEIDDAFRRGAMVVVLVLTIFEHLNTSSSSSSKSPSVEESRILFTTVGSSFLLRFAAGCKKLVMLQVAVDFFAGACFALICLSQ